MAQYMAKKTLTQPPRADLSGRKHVSLKRCQKQQKMINRRERNLIIGQNYLSGWAQCHTN